jgi:Xaa-Pro aminopeptidase
MTMLGVGGAPVGALRGYSDAERQRRWDVTRALMDDYGADLLIVFPQFIPMDAMWLASQPGAVLFPRWGDPQILLGGEDVAIERERPPGWITDRQFVSLANGVYWGPAVAERLSGMALGNSTVAIAGIEGDSYLHMHNPEGYLNYTTVRSVLRVLPSSCKVIDGTPIVSRARYVRSDEEVEVLRDSTRGGEMVVDAIHQELRTGRPQVEVWAAGMLSVIGEGKLGNIAWCSGQWGEPRTRLVGPPPGVLDDGLYISTEIVVPGPGGAGQVAQCFVVGEPNEEALRLFEVNTSAFDAACGAMRPGATWGEVVEVTQRSADGSGCYIEFIMHGMGSGPLITPYNSHEPVKDDILLESTAFILKPCAVPEGQPWLARSTDVSWGDMVVVRPEGARRLGTRAMTLLASG